MTINSNRDTDRTTISLSKGNVSATIGYASAFPVNNMMYLYIASDSNNNELFTINGISRNQENTDICDSSTLNPTQAPIVYDSDLKTCAGDGSDEGVIKRVKYNKDNEGYQLKIPLGRASNDDEYTVSLKLKGNKISNDGSLLYVFTDGYYYFAIITEFDGNLEVFNNPPTKWAVTPQCGTKMSVGSSIIDRKGPFMNSVPQSGNPTGWKSLANNGQGLGDATFNSDGIDINMVIDNIVGITLFEMIKEGQKIYCSFGSVFTAGQNINMYVTPFEVNEEFDIECPLPHINEDTACFLDTPLSLQDETGNTDDAGWFLARGSNELPRYAYKAIRVGDFDPTLPLYHPNNFENQGTWNVFNAECNALFGTSLASIHTRRDMEAFLKAMEYEKCQSSWMGMYDITGGTQSDYLWADGTPVGSSDFQGWSHFAGRNDPNSFTDDEPSTGYVELLIGEMFPQCGIFFWGDECGGDTAKHPCGVCYKYYTAAPTKAPSGLPTKAPSVTPTMQPSTAPSVSPSQHPTTPPTKTPTTTPTVSPTKTPTTTPTIAPTQTPSVTPTTSPSVTPTKTPTVSPTVSPTKTPSTTPTTAPSVSPSETPTTSPTKTPSVTPTKAPTDSPTVTPTELPTTTPTVVPTKQPTIATALDCGGELIVDEILPINVLKFSMANYEPYTGMEYTVYAEDLTTISNNVDKIEVRELDGAVIKSRNIDPMQVTTGFDNLEYGKEYEIVISFITAITKGRVTRTCFTRSPTTTPTVLPTLSPTITQGIGCFQGTIPQSVTAGQTDSYGFTNGGVFIGMTLFVESNGVPLTVTSIVITNTNTGAELKRVENTDSITITQIDDGLVNGVAYTETIVYATDASNVQIIRTCLTQAPTAKPTTSPVTTTTTTTLKPTQSPTITQLITCDDVVNINGTESDPITEITFKFTVEEDTDGMKYEVTNEDGTPSNIDKITITDKNGGIIDEVTDINEINVDRTDGLVTDEPYTVTVTFKDPETNSVNIGKECYTKAPTIQPTTSPTTTPTLLPTLKPTIVQDIPCGESLNVGAGMTGQTTIFTFTNGGGFTGTEFTVTENGLPHPVMIILITDLLTNGQQMELSSDRISKTIADNQLVNGRLYQVQVTYFNPGFNIAIHRKCFTNAPTAKPTESPVTSTLQPSKSPVNQPTSTPTLMPTILNVPECYETTTIPASPVHPVSEITFEFTIDQITEATQYLITDIENDQLFAERIIVTDINGDIIKEVTTVHEIVIDKTEGNGGLIINEPYFITIIITSTPTNPNTPPQTANFKLERRCFTVSPTLQPTLSPTVVQDIPCGESLIVGNKNTDDTSVFTFTNGGGFIGMEFIITDNGNPLNVSEITIIDTDTGATFKSLTNVDSILITNEDDNLINNKEYQVTITYNTPGTNINIFRSCITLAPTTKPTNYPTKSPLPPPSKAPTMTPSYMPTNTPTQSKEVIIEEPEPIWNYTFNWALLQPCPGTEFSIEDLNGNPLPVESIEVTDPDTGEVVKKVRLATSMQLNLFDGFGFGLQFSITINFNFPILKAVVIRECITFSPTLTPTNPPTILHDIICNDESIIEDYRGLTTSQQTFIPGNGMQNINIYIKDDTNNPLIVDKIAISHTSGILIKEVFNANVITFDEADGGFNPLSEYKLIIIYPDNIQKVIIYANCQTNAPTLKPTTSTTTEATTTLQPSKSPTITNDIDCDDELTVQASNINPISQYTFAFTTDVDTTGTLYVVSNSMNLPMNPERITINDKDGNIVKEVTNTNQIEADKTPGNGGLITDDPYTVTIVFTSNPAILPPMMFPFTIERKCLTAAPTLLPTISPTVTQDIPCYEVLDVGAVNENDTTTFTFTSGSQYAGVEFCTSNNNAAYFVKQIIITDTVTGQRIIKWICKCVKMRTNENLVPGRIYNVYIEYGTPGETVKIHRNCFTDAPTQKPTQSPVTSTKRPTTSPTITNDIECDDDLTVPATPFNPVNEFTFDFTADDDVEGMKYEVTDTNGNPINVDITVKDDSGNIVHTVSNAPEIIVDRTPSNGEIQSDEPYSVTVTFTTPSMIPFTIFKECYTSAPTLQPTLSPTVSQDIPCGDTKPILPKITGQNLIFTFTNGGEFDGMTFTITDSIDNPLSVTSIKITDSNGDTLKENTTPSDSITVTNIDDNLINGEVYSVEIVYSTGGELGSNVLRDCFTNAPTTKPTKSPTVTPELECDDEEGVQTDEPIESFIIKFDTDDTSEVGMDFIVKDEFGNELPADTIMIKNSNRNIVKSITDASKIGAVIDNTELLPNEDYSIEIIFENPLTTFSVERYCFTLAPTKSPTLSPTKSPTILQELDCGENLRVINKNGIYMTELEFQPETPYFSMVFIVVDDNNVALPVEALHIQTLSGSTVKRVNGVNSIEFGESDTGFSHSETYRFIVDYDDNNILDELFILRRCYTKAPTKTPTTAPTLTPTTSPTIDTKCSEDDYLIRTFDETNLNGLGLYSTTMEDNYIILKYKGNGDSYIRLCFSKDCQITGAQTYTNPFFEITLDEVGNTATYSLKYIDTDANEP